MDKLNVPEGYHIEMTGEDETISDSMSQLVLMMILAVIFIYLIMVVQFRIRLFLCLHIDFIIFDVCGNRGCALAVCHLRTDKLIYLCNRVSVFRSFFFIHGNGKLWFHIFQTIVHIHGSLCLLHHIRHFFGKLLQRINIISFNSDGYETGRYQTDDIYPHRKRRKRKRDSSYENL